MLVANGFAVYYIVCTSFGVYWNHGATAPCGDGRYNNLANTGVIIDTRWEGETGIYAVPGHWLPAN